MGRAARPGRIGVGLMPRRPLLGRERWGEAAPVKIAHRPFLLGHERKRSAAFTARGQLGVGWRLRPRSGLANRRKGSRNRARLGAALGMAPAARADPLLLPRLRGDVVHDVVRSF